jgi:predicted HTH transcriptional regulator
MNNSSFNQSSTQKSIADVMELPDEQRQIVNWISRNPKVTLEQIVEHTKLTEDVTQQHLQDLVAQGFIQELQENDSVYYQRHLVNKQKSKLSPKILDNL